MRPVARKEMRDALRNHWLQGYAALLAGLGLVTFAAAAESSAGLPLQTFGRAAASLTNLSLLLAPLVALMLGAASIAGERDRGTLERLLAQPLDRRTLLLDKYSGLLLSLLAATAVGFLPSGIAAGLTAGSVALVRFAAFPLLSMAVIAALLGVGFLVSVRSQSVAQAQARAIFLWFVFVLLYDLVLMGVLMATRIGPAVLAGVLLLNPVGAVRLLVVLQLEADLYLLGPAGAWLVETFSRGGAALLLASSLVAWGSLSLLLALRAFRLPGSRRRPRRPFVPREESDSVGESTGPSTLNRVRSA